MRENLNKNQMDMNKMYTEIEQSLFSIKLRDVSIPTLHLDKYTLPVKSGYFSFFESVSLTQKRILSIMMSVPALALILSFAFWSYDDSSEIYLASNDVKMLEASNDRILDKINSLNIDNNQK